MRARCSQQLSTNQTPHPTTKAGQQPNPPPKGRNHPRFPQLQGEEVTGLLSQSPIVCLMINLNRCFPTDQRLSCPRTPPTTGAAHPSNRPGIPNPHAMWAGLSLVVLLRKEVIQPHL